VLKQIDLLRHGEPLGGRRYRGQIDDPLSDKGWEEMRAAVDGRNDWDAIVHSPLRRCADFAAELSIALAIPKTADERLMEIGFGAWEGLTGDEVRAKDKYALQRFYLDPVVTHVLKAPLLSMYRMQIPSAGMVSIHFSEERPPALLF
jgi:alpha-ribazole phosphatase/probable phosphoglycerate mutase